MLVQRVSGVGVGVKTHFQVARVVRFANYMMKMAHTSMTNVFFCVNTLNFTFDS